MTISEAIELLEGTTSDLTIYEVPDFLDAIKLGIEALKRVLQISPYPHEYTGGPMPGETKE